MRYPDVNGETYKSKPKFTEHLTKNLNLTPEERKLATVQKSQDMRKRKLF